MGQLEKTARAAAKGDLDGAARFAASASRPLPAASPRPRVGVGERAWIYRRDSFTCWYCGTRTIPEPVLRTLSLLFPEELPWHANWKVTETHPAYFTLTSSCDHLLAGTRHGEWGGEENLVTACARCNYSKSSYTLEELGWETPISRPSPWMGLTDVYSALFEIARGQGKTSPSGEKYHRQWLRAFDAADARLREHQQTRSGL